MCLCARGEGGYKKQNERKIERCKDAKMKRFRGKDTNSICTAVSACSNYSSFEAESSKSVLLAHPDRRRRREREKEIRKRENRGWYTDRREKHTGEEKEKAGQKRG